MSEPGRSARIRILLVDDLEENLLALSALLGGQDLELLTARSAAEALELLLVHEVALALLDVQMPEVDGFELAELMRGAERTRHVPIIFVTAGGPSPQRLFRGYDSGAVDFLYKPIDGNILRHKVNVFVELARQRMQLADQLRQLTETLRLNEMFTAVLGHDLRNPLNAVMTSADLLSRRSTDEAVRRTAGRILTSSKRMGRMIEDVLDLARARLAGGIPLKRAEADLSAVVNQVIDEYRASSPLRRIDARGEGDLSGSWDADRLSQVASNLIGNALQHGSQAGAVEVRMDGRAPDRVRLSVSNAGAIPAESRDALFDPFRARTERGGDRGLGLGLFIVQQIVEAHHGQVEVDSSVEGRTTFHVDLPRRVEGVVRL